MKENFKLGLILLIITSIAGFALGLANNATAEAIAQNSKINKDDLKLILPNADSIKTSDLEPTGIVKEILEAYNGSELAGYVLKVAPKGFHGEIDMMVAIDNDGKQTGIKVISQSETPGVGSKIELPDFQEKFRDKNTDKLIKVVKTAPSNPNEVEGISGATISSNAVATGANEAIKFYKANIKGEAAEEDNKTINLKALKIEGDKLGEEESLKDNSVIAVNKVMKGDQLVGYVITSSSIGIYEGDIKVATAIDINKKVITGIQVLEQNETSGIGDIILEEDFTGRFSNKSTDEGKVSVDTVSGATISTKAVIEAVTKVLTYFNSNLKG